MAKSLVSKPVDQTVIDRNLKDAEKAKNWSRADRSDLDNLLRLPRISDGYDRDDSSSPHVPWASDYRATITSHAGMTSLDRRRIRVTTGEYKLNVGGNRRLTANNYDFYVAKRVQKRSVKDITVTETVAINNSTTVNGVATIYTGGTTAMMAKPTRFNRRWNANFVRLNTQGSCIAMGVSLLCFNMPMFIYSMIKMIEATPQGYRNSLCRLYLAIYTNYRSSERCVWNMGALVRRYETYIEPEEGSSSKSAEKESTHRGAKLIDTLEKLKEAVGGLIAPLELALGMLSMLYMVIKFFIMKVFNFFRFLYNKIRGKEKKRPEMVPGPPRIRITSTNVKPVLILHHRTT